MIRHRPSGSGHPYSDDTEQRSPVQPVAGEPLRIGARTSSDVENVTLELRIDGGGVREVPLDRVARSSRGQAVDGGHLASAQARTARSTGGWEVVFDTPDAGSAIEYRLVAIAADRPQATRWFRTRAAGWRPAPNGALEVDGNAVEVDVDSIDVLDDGERIHRIRFAVPLQPSEHVSGFGERYDALDQRGEALDSVVFEQYKSQGENRRTYLPMPFAHVVGGEGWGFHVRTSRRVWFDVGRSYPDRLAVEAEVDAAAGEQRVLSLGLYAGHPTAVLEAFVAETGRAQALPDWVFGLWASGNEWNTQAEVERQMALHREHRIPVRNVVIEAWSDEATFTIFRDAEYTVREDSTPMRLGDFVFPAEGAWPDPKGMVDDLHSHDVRVHLWQIPLMKLRPHPKGQAAADARAAIEAGVLIRETAPGGDLRPYRNRGWWFPLSLMPDLTDERSADWWTEKRRYLVEEVGIDGFKTDGGEHAWGKDLVYLDGSSGAESNNRFPVAYAAAYGKLLASAGKEPVTFSRAGFTGSGAHGAFWAGDENSTWDAFRWSLLAGLSASSCGIVYWGWDIAGFSGPIPDPELYLRAMAASVFVPIMQYHSEFNHHRLPSNDRTPWNIADRFHDQTVIDEVRALVELRERLVPYLAASAERAVNASVPLMRPLYFDHPLDERVWDMPVQWMLGDALLIAPVLEPGALSWQVYLPAGEWVDVTTGVRFEGRQVIDVDVAERASVPVFVASQNWEGLRAVFE
ncbi:alpha-glucosidase (family GH31 glycosyl hydrolase) [Microbacterium halimionae]|uniref:Alpha-glucosidase (Family GH31 glycosyl hydrolase) n=1 Tax=Microbacterium halimionae TaxID=1526413 RepID=A0A7W3PLG2_9MICO|nr:TIM-barrel domain-containing protein [Microbacterium halimionae]MBA8815819.1 alpha-glucosidase (family GH31 glycosyl hydrolase) [Microbacterium halimionae]NII95865.1 alpha-glucosidase (family GH31 glycosyl hydrolase) [Microbacterium halimionae]